MQRLQCKSKFPDRERPTANTDLDSLLEDIIKLFWTPLVAHHVLLMITCHLSYKCGLQAQAGAKATNGPQKIFT